MTVYRIPWAKVMTQDPPSPSDNAPSQVLVVESGSGAGPASAQIEDQAQALPTGPAQIMVVDVHDLLREEADPAPQTRAVLPSWLAPGGICVLWSRFPCSPADNMAIVRRLKTVFPYVWTPPMEPGGTTIWYASRSLPNAEDPAIQEEIARLRRDNIALSYAMDSAEQTIDRLTADLATLTRAHTEATETVARLTAALEAAQRQIAIVEASRSWRWTQAYWHFMDTHPLGRLIQRARRRTASSSAKERSTP